MKTKYDIKLLNGSKQEVTYEGIETVTLPAAGGSGVKTFTAGEPLDEMTITPDFSGGDQTVEAPEGNVIRSGTITKPEDAEGKIAKGETLMGMTGEYVTPGMSKTVELDFSEAADETVVLDETTAEGFALNETYGVETVYVETDGAITAGETYTVTWDGVAYECIAQDASAVVAGGVALGNASGWGLADNDEPFVFAQANAHDFTVGAITDTEDGGTHTFSITQATTPAQTITAEGDERWSEVVINKPENLTPENVAKGVEIAGVKGVYEGVVYASLYRTFAASMNLLYSSYASQYSSGTLRVMIPSDAIVVKAKLSYASSYGASITIPDPSWSKGDEWPSTYISGSWRVFEAVKSFAKQYSQEKHVWAGGVAYYDPAQPLYLDTLTQGLLGAFHVPKFSTYMKGGYTGGSPYNVNFAAKALKLESCPPYKATWTFADTQAITILSGDIPSGAFSCYTGLLGPNYTQIIAISASHAENIGSSAFYCCTNLSSLTLSERVKTIGSNAFFNCLALKTVSFPFCETISAEAFACCISLTSAYFLGDSIPTIAGSVFYSTPIASSPPSGSIYVRASMLEAFQAASNWSAYSSAMVGLTDEQIAELEE